MEDTEQKDSFFIYTFIYLIKAQELLKVEVYWIKLLYGCKGKRKRSPDFEDI